MASQECKMDSSNESIPSLFARDNIKFRKIIIEKIRRDRINNSIEELRTLLQTHQTAEQNPDRLEKADILELAVRFLKEQASSKSNESYHCGFSHCLQETLRHLSLHAPLQPAAREQIKRFYVRQKVSMSTRLPSESRPQFYMPSKRHPTWRARKALWRPW
ncbi:transcription factor HES-5-like [Engraulis encrasicolus]|uniref:transcription factor HES-5-like n=1 Tax=Engraulis encrasicolus TaxID=184585 RepID=UPI002FCE9DA2